MMLIVFMSVPQGYYLIDSRYFTKEDAKEMETDLFGLNMLPYASQKNLYKIDIFEHLRNLHV